MVVSVEGDFLTLTINEETGLKIEQFIKLAQQLTHRTFTYSESDIKNAPDPTITFIGAQRVRRENFFAFFQTMLYIQGFATILHGVNDTEIIEIVYRAGPKRAELSTSARYVPAEEIPEFANQTGVQILTSVPLRYIPASAAQNQLRPFFVAGSGAGSVTFGVTGQSLIMQGFGPQVFAAYQLIQLVDVPPELPEQDIRLVRLDYQSPGEVVSILDEILQDRSQRVQQAQGGAAVVQVRQASGQLKAVAHTGLNAILLSGTPQEIVLGQELIAQLDVPVELATGDTHVIRLQNVLAEELWQTLNKFIAEDTQAQQQAAQQGQAVPARQPRRTVIVPHKASNSLVISSTASKFKQLQRVIDELDRRQPQVLIECAVVELTTRDATLLGVELGLIDLAAGEFQRPFGFTSFGLTSFQDLDGDGIPDTRLPSFEAPLAGFTGGIITSDDFAVPVIVNALQANDRANVLSLPSVVVNNNTPAVVKSEEVRPTQTISQGTATTTAGAGQTEDAGITLEISPSISTANYLRLNIDLTVSRFITPFDPNSVTAGVRASREIHTQVTMPSGHTMVLGGVIQDSESESSNGIPILKDIPILGWLFESWSTDRQKTNLYFFLTPYILDEEDFSDLAEQSFRKKLEAADYIGHRRIQLIDRKWRQGRPVTLEDPGATIEDLDRLGGFDIPFYERPERVPIPPPGPVKPQAQEPPPEPLPVREETPP